MLDRLYLELTDFQLDTLHDGLKLAMELSCIGNFANSLNDLVKFAYVNKDVLHPYWEKYANKYDDLLWKNKTIPEYRMNTFEDCAEWWDSKICLLMNKKKQCKKDQTGKRCYTIDLNDGTESLSNGLFTSKLKLDTFPLLLEMVVRVSLGQLNSLWMVSNGVIDIKTGERCSGLYSITSEEMAPYRERMFKIFPYGGNSSLGIGSPELSERVRTLYEIYKAFQYQYNCYGVDAYGPIKLSHTDDPLPVIGFKEQFVCDYSEDIKVLEKAYKEGIDDDYKILRTPIIDDGTLYFPVENSSCTTYQRMVKGQKLYRKVNGYYDIR